MTVSLRALVLALLAALAVMQVTLWCFLGSGALAVVGGALGLMMALVGLGRHWPAPLHVPLSDWALTTVLALAVLLIGGEGRWFYATLDWQVRYAVLRDLTLQPWPFAYTTPEGPLMLRLPVGMYLVPALVGKLGGFHAAEQALLVQNTLLLGMVLALGGALYRTARHKVLALALFWGFSGMDVIGQALQRRPLSLHLETWAGLQFSSHVTQALWVPQHALAGWIFAVFYLLWLQGKAPEWTVLACIWLVGLLSPLALMGCVPFAAHALVAGLSRREITLRDMGWLIVVAALCVPGLLYMVTSSGSVGAGQSHGWQHGWLPFIVIEVGPFLVALWLVRARAPFGSMAAALVVGTLLLVPFGQVGSSMDFTARASIPALAILSMMMARIVIDHGQWARGATARGWIAVAWLIGLATPAGELWRGIAWPAAPEVMCGYMGVVPGGSATYTAPWGLMPAVIRPVAPRHVTPRDPDRCWQAPWRDPINGAITLTHPY